MNYKILKERISSDNVLAMAEAIAFAETKYLIRYMGNDMQKAHVDLYEDIIHKHNISHVFSDDYDLVQECAVFLCEHYGQHLNEIIGFTPKGKPITVQIACIKNMTKLINRKWSDSYRCISADALTPVSEPSIEIKEEMSQDYSICDSIIESLNLTDNMRIALECRMAGLSYPEIGRILERTHSTVFEYFIKMRQRYIAIYG